MAGGDADASTCLACADPPEHLVLVGAEEDGKHSAVDELGLILAWQR